MMARMSTSQILYALNFNMGIFGMGFWTSSYTSFIEGGGRSAIYCIFPVDAVKENVNTPFPEWTEGFEFPPALLKLRATMEGAIIPLYHQGCIAINTRGPQRMAQNELGSVG